MTDRKKPGVAFWATVVAVVVVLVLYPLSWGPALWLQGSGYWPERLIWVDHVYDPLRLLLEHSPEPVDDAATHYLLWWATSAVPPYYNPATGEWE
jgi:hypothetical protein